MLNFRQILNVLLVTFLFVSAGIAQDGQDPSAPKIINGGVINGKARNLPIPDYPQAAKAVGASGTVNVQVLIDENGDVVSAAATSGHPLLRAAAVAAARQAKFTPTQLSGQPVKVNGVVVYNFVGYKANWFNIGSDLASLEKMPTLKYFKAVPVAEAIPAEWTSEKQQAQRLIELKQIEATQPIQPRERVTDIEEKTERKADGTTVKSKTKQFQVEGLEGGASSEQAGIAQSLIASLQGRLANDEKNLWYLNTGVALTRTLNNGGIKDLRLRELSVLKQQLQNAPTDIPTDFVSELQKLFPILEKEYPDQTDLRQLPEILGKASQLIPNN